MPNKKSSSSKSKSEFFEEDFHEKVASSRAYVRQQFVISFWVLTAVLSGWLALGIIWPDKFGLKILFGLVGVDNPEPPRLTGIGSTSFFFLGLNALALLIVGFALIKFTDACFLYLNALRNSDSSSIRDALLPVLERRSSSDIEVLRREYQQTVRDETAKLFESYKVAEIKKDIDRTISDHVQKDFKNGTIKAISKHLESKIFEASRRDELIGFIVDKFPDTRRRVLEYASKAENSAWLFRTIGLSLMVSGLTFAVARIFGLFPPSQALPNSVMDANPVVYFLLSNSPALSMIVFVEFLSLLFFRLYRRADEQMKYFSNEAVNLDLRLVASIVAIQKGSPSDLSRIVSSLVTNDRNPVLNQGQKTVAHLHNEGEKDDIRDFTALIPRVVTTSATRKSGRAAN